LQFTKYLTAPPLVLKQLTQNWLTWEMHPVGKKIYITFDDGPVPEVTPKVLQILKNFDAHATFFCVGDNVNKHSDLFSEIKADGHSVGNHTFNHLKAWKNPAGEYIRNVEKCRQMFDSRLFRPPYGQITPYLIQQLRKNYQIILWSVLSGDFNQNLSPEQCLQTVIRHTKPGSIIVFHDSIKASKNMLFVLPLFLEHFQRRGFEFERLNV
jgi:peptidoglycan-N-acetylglucosamine deacetylase